MKEAAKIFEDLPHASFHRLAQIVKASMIDPFVLQVGAMDGVLFDLLHRHIEFGGWRGILIEPLPDMFATLEKTYAGQPDLKLVNCAIADHDGNLTMNRVDPVAVGQSLVPQQALGITTSFKDRGFLADAGTASRYAPYMMEVEVPCRTLQSVLDEHRIEKIDVVVIDAEGADWIIARQLDLGRYRPDLLCIEHSHLPPAEVGECLSHMALHQYGFAVCEEDRENMLFYRKH